jgi:hypothetical protein
MSHRYAPLFALSVEQRQTLGAGRAGQCKRRGPNLAANRPLSDRPGFVRMITAAGQVLATLWPGSILGDSALEAQAARCDGHRTFGSGVLTLGPYAAQWWFSSLARVPARPELRRADRRWRTTWCSGWRARPVVGPPPNTLLACIPTRRPPHGAGALPRQKRLLAFPARIGRSRCAAKSRRGAGRDRGDPWRAGAATNKPYARRVATDDSMVWRSPPTTSTPSTAATLGCGAAHHPLPGARPTRRRPSAAAADALFGEVRNRSCRRFFADGAQHVRPATAPTAPASRATPLPGRTGRIELTPRPWA